MKIRLVSRDNGAGLARDLRLAAGELEAAGHRVQAFAMGNEKGVVAMREALLRVRRACVDVQLSFERVRPRLLPLAARNVLVPNPEWFDGQAARLLPAFDAVLCKTRHAVPAFAALGADARFVGFTSEDRMDAAVPRRRAFLHVAGRSSAKGTRAVVEAWRRHPEWPRLTVVAHAQALDASAPNIAHHARRIDDAQLRMLQNAHRFHVQPSEVEGFGHVLAEAMSTGAVVLATAGAPMDELVTPARGVMVPTAGARREGLATVHRIDADGVEDAVLRALALDDEGADALGCAARAWFVANDARFRACFPGAVTGEDAGEVTGGGAASG